MSCPNCHVENRAGANFCKNCGTLLRDTCPRCNSKIPADANFCDNCGLRLRDPSGWWLPAPSDSTRAQNVAPPKPKSESPPAPASTPTSDATTLASPVRVTSRASLASPAGPNLQQYIPQALKAKIDAARASGENAGERKQVTVLFTDIVGSTALAEKLDPEEWGEIVSGMHRRVSEAVYRYEGTIAQLLGDGALAFFGAPITHEDDAARAVNAALDIQKSIHQYHDELRAKHRVQEFNMRIGLNTGLVVVGNIGDDMHMEYLAVGDAINLAARMEQTATPGTIQVAQDTYKLVKQSFDFEALGGTEVKGTSEPVPAYRVLGRKESLGRVRGIEGLYVDMVGRETELQTLRGVLADLKQGVGRIVCVLGEAGLGKTRLISESFKVFKELTGTEGDWFET